MNRDSEIKNFQEKYSKEIDELFASLILSYLKEFYDLDYKYKEEIVYWSYVDCFYYDFSCIDRKFEMPRDSYLLIGITSNGIVYQKWVDRHEFEDKFSEYGIE